MWRGRSWRVQLYTLFLRGVEILRPILEEGKIRSLKHINCAVWYKICTETRYYTGIEEVIDYAFRFLLRDSNECTVESAIGDIDYVKVGKGTRRTRLTYENHHNQMFIRKNGPSPMVSESLRIQALQYVFQDQQSWNFIVSRNLASMPSQLLTKRLRKAKQKVDCCFC